jgi:hypothetical protein
MTNITDLRLFCAGILFLLLPFLAQAQFTYQYHKTQNIKPVGHWVPDAVSMEYSPVLVPEEMPYPGAEIDRLESQSLKRGGQLKPLVLAKKAQMGSAPAPEILDTLSGNPFSGSVPNDDSFAVNRNGQAISVRNSTIGMYDVVNDSVLFNQTLFRFYRPSSLGLPGSKYDPRVIYDPEADRFIVLYLSGNTWQVSKIIAAFSKTSNPLDGFNIYQIDGHPLQDSTWSDYPHISQSKDDLFITMNTFTNGSTNNSGYVQSTIRQVSKQAGYDSLALTEHYYYNLKSGNRNLFNFTGMTSGGSLKDGPFYVLSNRNLDATNDSIFVVKIDGKAAAGTPQLTMQPYLMENPYGLPPSARQANNHTFDCNDSRIQGGFFQNDRIQFVGNTITSNGNSGIYHGIISIGNAQTSGCYFKILDFDPIDIGYPQITYTGKSYTENEAIITFNHTGDSLNAGFSSVFFDNDSTYSNFTMLIEGGDYVDIISSGGDPLYERWGDYTGAQPAYGDTGVIWASGYEASANGQPLTTIVKLRSPNYNKAPLVGQKENTLKADVNLAPNPVDDWFMVSFNQEKATPLTFNLVSSDGRQSIFKIEEYAYRGKNTFRFNTKSLEAGLYMLIMQEENGKKAHTFKVLVK